MNHKIGLITIATGARYRLYARNMLNSAATFFKASHQIVFTDAVYEFPGTIAIHVEPKGFPNETLYRYDTMLKEEDFLSSFDYLFYSDADMLWVAGADFELKRGLIATTHPGYAGLKGTTERRQESTAYCTDNIGYYAGGFQGGSSCCYLEAVEEMSYNIRKDAGNGIVAVWHDESHWNKYVSKAQHRGEPVTILPPDYCYPENAGEHYKKIWADAGIEATPRLLALEKGKR